MNKEYFSIGEDDTDNNSEESIKRTPIEYKDERRRGQISQFRTIEGGPISYRKKEKSKEKELETNTARDGRNQNQAKRMTRPKDGKGKSKVSDNETETNSNRRGFWSRTKPKGTTETELAQFLGQEDEDETSETEIMKQRERDTKRHERARETRERRAAEAKSTLRARLSLRIDERNKNNEEESEPEAATSAHEMNAKQILKRIKSYTSSEGETENEPENCKKCMRRKARKELIEEMNHWNEDEIKRQDEEEEIEEVNREIKMGYLNLVKRLGIKRTFWDPEMDLINRFCLEYTAQSVLVNEKSMWKSKMSESHEEVYKRLIIRTESLGSPITAGDPGPEAPILLTEVVLGRFRIRSDGTTEAGERLPTLSHNGTMNSKRFKTMVENFYMIRDHQYKNRVDISRHRLDETV